MPVPAGCGMGLWLAGMLRGEGIRARLIRLREPPEIAMRAAF